MIVFAPITPAEIPVQEGNPGGDVKEGSPTQDEAITAAESKVPPFMLEPTASRRSRPVGSRSRHMGPPVAVRVAAREEIQLTLGF
jgi:hypothetical protein